MLGEVGHAAYEMTDGWVRFLLDHDLAAGRASSAAMRSLIEFLVGRDGRRKPGDFWPSDAHDDWSVDRTQVQHLRGRLDRIDKSLAHLSLDRAKGYQSYAQPWGDTVAEVLALTRRYADEISGHPAHAKLAAPLAAAEARLAMLPTKRCCGRQSPTAMAALSSNRPASSM